MRTSRYFAPSAMERKCLSHLDHTQNWEYLKRPRPSEDEILPWRPFLPIFRYNLALFTVVFAVLTSLVVFNSGVDSTEIMEDLTAMIGIVLGLASMFAFYVANLYRRTWNRRARTKR